MDRAKGLRAAIQQKEVSNRGGQILNSGKEGNI